MTKNKAVNLVIMIAVLAGCSLSGSAMADDSPLSNLFGGIAKALAPLAKASTGTHPPSADDTGSAQSITVSDSQIEHALTTIGESPYSNCFEGGSKTTIDRSVATVKSNIEAGDFNAASLNSKIGAQMIAQCFVTYKKNSYRDRDINYPLATWARLVGDMIYTNLAMDAKLGDLLRDSVHKKAAENAKLLLLYAEGHGDSEAADSLASLNKVLDSTKDATASNKAELSGSAISIVEKYNTNKFGFEQKYMGKTIETYGAVTGVTGTSRSVIVSILGNTKLDNDHIGFQHHIACDITDAQSISKAGDLEKGRQVKVRGVFDHDTRYNAMARMQINLSGCQIVQ